MKKLFHFLSIVFVAIAVMSCGSPTISGLPVSIDDYYATAEIGDYILKDGIICKQADLTDENKSNVVAVIFRKATASAPALGVALKNADNGTWSSAKGKCDIYGTTKSYLNFTSGWYLPSSAELQTLAASREIIDASLDKLTDKDNFYENSQSVGNCILWSNTEASDSTDEVLTVDVNTKNTTSAEKTDSKKARAIRAFTTKPINYAGIEAGDIILENGLMTKPSEYCSKKAAAVVYKVDGDVVKTVGIKWAGKEWCTDTADGYNKKLVLLGKITDSSQAYDLLCMSVTDALTNSDNYPAWKYCATYGITNNYTKLATGWTMPTKVELKAFNSAYQATDSKVKSSLVSIDSTLDISDGKAFWTCNQAVDTDKSIFMLKISGNKQLQEKNADKSGSCCVIPFRVFNTNQATVDKVDAPEFSVTDSYIDANTAVTITCSTTGASIFYKIDNGEYTEYITGSSDLKLNPGERLYAIAVKDGLLHSDITSRYYGYPPVY